jgi:hypothetical protein
MSYPAFPRNKFRYNFYPREQGFLPRIPYVIVLNLATSVYHLEAVDSKTEGKKESYMALGEMNTRNDLKS